MGLQHSVPKRHHKNKRKNIMNIQEEKRVCFDVDQNKQKINFLLKKNKENETNFSSLDSRLTNAETSITNLNFAISDLQDSTSDEEEKVELGSYDCYKTKDRIYRDTCWLPRPVGFVAENGKMFKFRVRFDAVSTFETTITSTAKITLDEIEIYSDTKEIPAGGTHSVDFEYITSSEKSGHKIEIELRNTETPARRTNCCIPDFLTIELWGTNVQFISRNCDFYVIPAESSVVMTTLVYDHPQVLFSMQPADSNLSLEQSAFKFFKANDYRNYNVGLPSILHTFDEEKNTIIYSDKPSVFIYTFENDGKTQRIAIFHDVDGNNESAISSNDGNVAGMILKPLMSNADNFFGSSQKMDFVTISPYGYIFVQHKTGVYATLTSKPDTRENVDCCGLLRLGNTNLFDQYFGVTTRQNGTSFFWSREISSNPREHQQLELGFGTHSNAYLLPNNQAYIFLRVGKNIKKIILSYNAETHYFEYVSSSIIPNVQEYWLAPNGNHFERVGNKINYYIGNSKTPKQTLTVFC